MAIDAALGRLGIRPGVCTSSTRPANPFEGQVIYETDTNNIRFWSGSAWESNKGGIVSSSAPTGAAAGDIWYDSDDGRAYIYYDDGSSQQWVEFGAPPVQHGKILQVVSTTKNDTFSASVTAGNTTAVTGLSASLTCSDAANSVLVIVHLGMVSNAAGDTTCSAFVQADSTSILVGATAGSRTPVGQAQYGSITGQLGANTTGLHIVGVYSPASTSAISYTVHLHNYDGSTNTMYVNRSHTDSDSATYPRAASSLILLEVAG